MEWKTSYENVLWSGSENKNCGYDVCLFSLVGEVWVMKSGLRSTFMKYIHEYEFHEVAVMKIYL